MIRATVKIDLSGLHNYNDITLPSKIQAGLNATALQLEADIKNNFSPVSPSTPGDPPGVDTGFLRSSIHVESVSSLIREVIAGAEYSEPLEYGTFKMAPRPFMRPAFFRIQDQIQNIWKEVFRR